MKPLSAAMKKGDTCFANPPTVALTNYELNEYFRETICYP